MNFFNRLQLLFLNPKKVFIDIKENPDYNGLYFTGIIAFPFVIISTIILASKVIYDYPSYVPSFLVNFIKMVSLMTEIGTFVYGLMVTWIFLTLFVTIFNKILKKDYLFRDLLPATSYVLIPLILLQIVNLYFYSTLKPVTVTISTSNNDSSSKLLNLTNQLYFNPIFIGLHLIILLILILILSFMISTYFELNPMKSFIISLGYFIFELIRLMISIIIIPILMNLLQQLQSH